MLISVVALTFYTIVNVLFFIWIIVIVAKLIREKKEQNKVLNNRMDIIEGLLTEQFKEVLGILKPK